MGNKPVRFYEDKQGVFKVAAVSVLWASAQGFRGIQLSRLTGRAAPAGLGGGDPLGQCREKRETGMPPGNEGLRGRGGWEVDKQTGEAGWSAGSWDRGVLPGPGGGESGRAWQGAREKTTFCFYAKQTCSVYKIKK